MLSSNSSHVGSGSQFLEPQATRCGMIGYVFPSVLGGSSNQRQIPSGYQHSSIYTHISARLINSSVHTHLLAILRYLKKKLVSIYNHGSQKDIYNQRTVGIWGGGGGSFSWKPSVLEGIWKSRNRQFFDSGIVKETPKLAIVGFLDFF